MKKGKAAPEKDDIRPEYNLAALKGGVRGKYLNRFRAETNLAWLARVQAVIKALRSLLPRHSA